MASGSYADGLNERQPSGVKEMDALVMFIAEDGDIITHLVKPCKQRCVDAITHLNEFPAALFVVSQARISDINLHYVFFNGNPLSLKSHHRGSFKEI